VFDAMRADFSKRIDLLRAFGAIDESWAPQLNRAAEALAAERERRKLRAAGEIADLLESALTAVVAVPLRHSDPDREAARKARARLRELVRKKERTARRVVQEIYHHGGLKSREAEETYLDEDVFSERSFSMFGLSTTQLAMTGAASGAVAGGVVDVALGGASLLLGAGIGAAIGAFGAVAGANRLAKVEILGQPLGGFELRVGPITDPNLPWVVLGRALLHVRLVAERNHARREELVVDAAAESHFADTIDAAQRRRLETLFRTLRAERGLDAGGRAQLVELITALIETP
jgi:hypothetical protein